MAGISSTSGSRATDENSSDSGSNIIITTTKPVPQELCCSKCNRGFWILLCLGVASIGLGISPIILAALQWPVMTIPLFVLSVLGGFLLGTTLLTIPAAVFSYISRDDLRVHPKGFYVGVA